MSQFHLFIKMQIFNSWIRWRFPWYFWKLYVHPATKRRWTQLYPRLPRPARKVAWDGYRNQTSVEETIHFHMNRTRRRCECRTNATHTRQMWRTLIRGWEVTTSRRSKSTKEDDGKKEQLSKDANRTLSRAQQRGLHQKKQETTENEWTDHSISGRQPSSEDHSIHSPLARSFPPGSEQNQHRSTDVLLVQLDGNQGRQVCEGM